MRRRGRLVGAALAGVASALLALWAISRLATDHWLWSQWLWWVPAGAYAAAIVLAAAPIRRRPRMRLALLLLALLPALDCALRELGALHRPGPQPASLRVLSWNVSWITDQDAVLRTLLREDPDVAVLVNPHTGVGWNRLFGRIPYQYALLYRDGFVVISKYPIHQFGSRWLGIEGLPDPAADPNREDSTQAPYRDPGRALWFDVDAGATLGRTFTVWAVDLPSQPRLSRWTVASEARSGIESWAGPRMLRDEQGGYHRDAAPVKGFPAADIVLGDLNITRGSASLGELAPGFHNAYGDGGRGWSGTYPRRFPIVHIDQILLMPGLRAGRYRVIDPGVGHHLAQAAAIAIR